MRAQRRQQQGFTLLENMMALAIVGVLVAGAISLSVYYMRTVRKAVAVGQREDIKRHIVEMFSCEKSIPTQAAQCAANTYIAGHRIDSVVGVPGSEKIIINLYDAVTPAPTKFGSYEVRLRCQNTGTGAPGDHAQIFVEYRAVSNAGEILNDPVTGVALDWQLIDPEPMVNCLL